MNSARRIDPIPYTSTSPMLSVSTTDCMRDKWSEKERDPVGPSMRPTPEGRCLPQQDGTPDPWISMPPIETAPRRTRLATTVVSQVTSRTSVDRRSDISPYRRDDYKLRRSSLPPPD